MSRTAINNQSMRRNNRSMVLDCVRSHKELSRADLKVLLGLMPATITNIVGALIDEGMLKETVSIPSARGRRPTMLRLNTSRYFAVGAQLSTHRMTCVITDLYGDILIGRKEAVDLNVGIEGVADRLSNFILSTLRAAKVPIEGVLRIGLVSAGPYDHERGIMINPPNFPGWHDVPICDMVAQRTGLPVSFEKDTVGLTLAEYWCGEARSVSSLFGVTVEEAGIGGGVMLDGMVYHGLGDSAGEIGHAPVEIDGELCNCGNHGCLETIASGFGMLRTAKARLCAGEQMRPYPGLDPDALTLDQLLVAANAEDPMSVEIVNHAARMVAFSIAHVIQVVSPEVVVLGGYVPSLCPLFFDIVRDSIQERGYPLYNHGTQVMRASFGEMQIALGGAGLVLQHVFNAEQSIKVV